MIVAGIDPGTRKTGYGIILREGSRIKALCSGVISLSDDLELHEKLVRIHGSLVEILEIHRPDAAAVEDIFYSRNARSALVLGHARGVSLLAAAGLDIPVFRYPPAKVKRSVVGSGRASKKQIQEVVRLILGLDSVPPEDAADALAVAICHSNASSTVIR